MEEKKVTPHQGAVKKMQGGKLNGDQKKSAIQLASQYLNKSGK